MKKILLSNAFLWFSFAVFAQPTLTSDKMLPYGSVMEETYITNYSMITTNSTGTNVNWDFSNVTLDANSDVLNVTVVNPSTTPYASTFTNSNYAYHETQGTVYDDYTYYNLTSSKMERVGSDQSGTAVTYSDPQTELVFPLTLNTINNDTWDNSASSGGGGDYDLTCVATGTLKIPSGTYNNVLMVKVHLTEPPFLDFYTYLWYNADNGSVLFEYLQGDGFFVSDQACYLSNLTLGTGTVTATTNAYLQNIKYNNPVTTDLKVDFGNQTSFSGKYTITTALGEPVKEGVASSQQTLNVACSDLKQGMYLISFYAEQNADQKKSIRFVKQ